MIKNSVFLGTKGITSTSANYLSSLAIDVVEHEREYLEHLQFYSIEAGLLSSSEQRLIEKGNTKEDVEKIADKLQKIAKMHAFAAWMREAVKAKEEMLNDLEAYPVKQWAEDNGKEYPNTPAMPAIVIEDNIISEMSVKERNDYLTLEAFASTFGKAVHKDGYVSKARQDLLEILHKPSYADGTGRDTVVYNTTPTVDTQDIESVYQNLQDTYRSYEQRLNSIKFKIREEVNRRNSETNRVYKDALTEYSNATKILISEYNLWKIAKKEEISKLRIIIPEQLQDTFNYLNSLGKVSES